MNSDEEYLDDLLSSLVGEEEKADLLPSEEGTVKDVKLDEGMVPEDLDFAAEDFALEDFDPGDFALEDVGEEVGPEQVQEMETGLENISEETHAENSSSEEALGEELVLEDISEENQGEEPALEDISEEGQGEELVLEDISEEGQEEEPVLEDISEEGQGEELALEDIFEENQEESIAEEMLEEDSAAQDIPATIAEEEATSEDALEGEPVLEEYPEEGSALEDFALEDFVSEDFTSDDFTSEDFILEGAGEEEQLFSPDEVDAMFAAAHAAANESDDLSDTESQIDDMFDFLDGMSEEENANLELGDLDEDMEQGKPTLEDDGEESGKKKKKSKKEKKSQKEKKSPKEKKPLFGKKKKKGQPEEGAGEGTEEGGGMSEAAGEGEKNKPQGFLGRIMAFLTESDDEDAEGEGAADGLEPSDENKNILKELDDEDKNKKKKKVKGKGDEDDTKEKKKKEKKEKKEKKKKEKSEPSAEAEQEKSAKKGKKVSVKSIAPIAGFSLTVAAMIIVICSIIPDFFEKRQAREAFYQSDYTKSYELLYGKKLDESDEIIYNKSKTILEMRRKLDSYHNYLGMGQEVWALDALMSGVERYPEILAKAEEYRVTQEVNAIYESILNILSDKYSLTESLAHVIIEYDDVTYTRRLESIVNNTPFIMPQEKETVVPSADILPEEQDWIEEELPAETEEDVMAGNASASEPEGGANGQEEFPTEELPQEQGTEGMQTAEPEPEVVDDSPAPESGSSAGEDVSTWTGNGGYGSQGEQIQGIRQPIGIEIHGN